VCKKLAYRKGGELIRKRWHGRGEITVQSGNGVWGSKDSIHHVEDTARERATSRREIGERFLLEFTGKKGFQSNVLCTGNGREARKGEGETDGGKGGTSAGQWDLRGSRGKLRHRKCGLHE